MFSKIKVNKTVIKNRIVRSATNEHLGSLQGLITDEYLRVYSNLATNGVGLIITSHMAVNDTQRVDETQICVNDSNNYSRLKELSKIVHQNGSKILVQLSQGGRKAYFSSVKKSYLCNYSTEMSLDEIYSCINNFTLAAKVIENAGFDGIQLHLAHGYLLSDFLDPFYNKRNDEYGGSIKKRYRIVHEIVRSIRSACSSEFILSVKINSTSKSDVFLDLQMEVCKLLQNDGIDLIEISGMGFAQANKNYPYFLNEALKIRDVVSIPIALVGGFRNIEQINMAIDKGIDLVSLSRPFICEEDLVIKLKEGRDSICNDCNLCYSIYRNSFKRCVFHDTINKQLKLNFEIK